MTDGGAILQSGVAVVSETAVTVVDAAAGQLSLWGTPRLPAPPSSFIYDATVERQKYCRSLLTTEEVDRIEAEIEKSGYMTMAQVREIIKGNTVKESMDARGEIYAIDPEFMMIIDTRINFPVFIAGDNVYTREELYEHYPFADLAVEPENIFIQQEIGVFPARKYAMAADEFEYIARDAGDETVAFVMIEDMVGAASRRNYAAKRAPVKVVMTKVFLGKEKWHDFCLVHRVAKGVANISGGAGRSPFLATMLRAAPAQGLLMDEATTNARLQKIEDEMQRREEEAARREKEAARREEEAKKMEAKVQADLARLEAMYVSMRKVSLATARAVRPHKPSPPVTESMSTPAPSTTASTDLDNDAELLQTLSELAGDSVAL